jgi:hypothetical protein
MFSVEDSVIEYSDHSFKFLKPSDPSPKDSLLHLFNRWEGSITDTASLVKVTMDTSKKIAAVFSLTGKRVAVLADGAYGPGTYLVQWNGMDAAGKPVGSGIYFCRMVAGNFVRINKMQLLR